MIKLNPKNECVWCVVCGIDVTWHESEQAAIDYATELSEYGATYVLKGLYKSDKVYDNE